MWKGQRLHPSVPTCTSPWRGPAPQARAFPCWLRCFSTSMAHTRQSTTLPCHLVTTMWESYTWKKPECWEHCLGTAQVYTRDDVSSLNSDTYVFVRVISIYFLTLSLCTRHCAGHWRCISEKSTWHKELQSSGSSSWSTNRHHQSCIIQGKSMPSSNLSRG